jgi:Anti-sigma factor NepR
MDGHSTASKRTEGSLGKDVQASLGRLLADHYQKIVKEGVPDRFADLLQRYEQKIQGSSAQGAAEAPDVAKSAHDKSTHDKGAGNEGKDPAE